MERLPSPTSRVDIIWLFIRHILTATGVPQNSCEVLLLGYSGNSLGGATLARDSRPKLQLLQQVNDGLMHVPETLDKKGRRRADRQPAEPAAR